MSEVAILHTERLLLRRHQLSDFPDSLRLWSDATVTQYIGGKPSTEQEVWSRLLRYAGHWALLGFGYWVATDRASGKFIGELGFADAHRKITPSLAGVPEIGWALLPEAQGRGLASEGAQAAVKWGEQQWGARRTVCIVSPENLASIRVAEKNGYKELARTTYEGEPTLVFER